MSKLWPDADGQATMRHALSCTLRLVKDRGIPMRENLFFELHQIRLENETSGEELATTSYPITNSNYGLTAYDLQNIIDPYLKYDMPRNLELGSNSSDGQTTTSSRMIVRLKYSTWAPGINNNWTSHPDLLYVIKGGWRHMGFDLNYQQNASNQFTTTLKFYYNRERACTMIPSGRTMTPDEWGWLLYATEQNVDQVANYNITYKDGTTANINRTFGTGGCYGKTFFIPLGVEQAALDPSNKGVVSYELHILTTPGFPQDLLTYKINIDSRPYYNSRVLYYRNSMGGVDHIRLRGITMVGAETSKQEYRQFPNIQGNYEGENPFFNSKLRYRFKGNTGYISRAHALALADAFNSTGAWFLHKGNWVNLRIPPQKMPDISSAEQLYNVTIEFETANEFDVLPEEVFDIETYNPGVPGS